MAQTTNSLQRISASAVEGQAVVLEELGHVEGRDIEFIWRFGDGKFDRLRGLASELAKLEVDVIMPATPPAIYAAKAASSVIPIGLVSTLARRNRSGLLAHGRRAGGAAASVSHSRSGACRRIA